MLENVAVALFLSAVIERIVEALIAKPMEQKLPEVDRWFLMYVALVGGGALSFVVEMNIFPVGLMPEMVGMALTAVLVGGGTKLLHSVMEIDPGGDKVSDPASILPAYTEGRSPAYTEGRSDYRYDATDHHPAQ